MRRHKVITTLVLTFASTTLMANNTLPQPPAGFAVTALQLPAGCEAGYATGISSNGHITGITVCGIGQIGVLWTPDGSISRLKPLFSGGASLPEQPNDSGVVAGRATIDDDFHPDFHATVWRGGTIKDIHPYPDPNEEFNSWAHDINNDGVVVLEAQPDFGEFRAVIWKHGSFQDLGGLCASSVFSYAFGINEADAVVGGSYPCGAVFEQAFMWLEHGAYGLPAGMTNLNDPALGLPTLPPSTFVSWGVDVNDLGEVVGQWVNDDDFLTRSFVWVPATTLGTQAGMIVIEDGSNQVRARALNDQRQVVGRLDVPGPNAAFLWQSGTVLDLNDLIPAGTGWQLMEATGINDAGKIVGSGTLAGLDRPFLLTPTSPGG